MPTPALPSPGEMLRERVEGVRDDPAAVVHGEPIAARRALAELYANRGFTPAWTSAGARVELLRAIRDSALDGLDPEDYHLSALEQLYTQTQAPGAPEGLRLDYDILQTDALARLLYHLSSGKLDPTELTPHWDFNREVKPRPARAIRAVGDRRAVALRGDRAHEAAAPAVPHAARRARALPRAARARRLVADRRRTHAEARRAQIDASSRCASGSSRPASSLPAPRRGDARVFDDSVEAAVRAFQRANGLDADGAVGAGTLAVLNLPIDARIAQIEVNLERGRWLLNDLDPTFVVINVAGFRAYYLRDSEVVWSGRVQVGKPYRQTPMFRSAISYLVLNPTWTVPPTILENDVLPAVKRDPGYLAQHHLRVIDSQGRPVTTPIHWADVTADGFPYLLREDAGADNPLGRVKFMFPNEFSVYLHDTPNQALFEKSERTFSSGCIRVENALELAALLLEGQEGWDAAALVSALATGETRTVNLQHRVPILVFYWTAWVDRDGVPQFRGDVYGLDARVEAGLATPFRADGE